MKDNEYKFVHPLKHLYYCLNACLEEMASVLATYARGADLEFRFCYKFEANSITLQPAKGEDAGPGDSLTIPAAGKVVLQMAEWECPQMKEGGTVLIKCTINHPAFHFIIVDDSRRGVGARRLFIVQVSHQFYQKRPAHQRKNIMESKPDALNNKTVSKYFSEA